MNITNTSMQRLLAAVAFNNINPPKFM